MIVSIALNMGLHRDGEQFGLDAYETEMRRRIWCCLVMLDGLNAATFGRPMMIADAQFDTKPLSSLNDGDLHRGLKFPLPHKDPNTFTDTAYPRAKYSLSMVARKIISTVFGIKPPSYDTILKLDGMVRDTYEQTPDVMRYESIHSLKGKLPSPSAAIAVQRLGLTLVANHSLVILHRPFLYRSFHDARYMPSREKCVEAAHQVLRLFHQYRNKPDYEEYSRNIMGALHAFHAGTVIGLRCYLEPLSCSERDWMALDAIRNEFEIVSKSVDSGWAKLGDKGSKVFSILIRKAIERKAILGGALGSKGITIGPSPTVPPTNSATPAISESSGFSGLNFTPSGDGYSSSTGLTPQYSGQPLFGTNQFDVNPLTNPAVDPYGFRAGTMLLGAGMPGVGVATSDSSPEQQPNWDIFLPKGTNLVLFPPKSLCLGLTCSLNGIYSLTIWILMCRAWGRVLRATEESRLIREIHSRILRLRRGGLIVRWNGISEIRRL
jgi:Fungal specific transcription factor domain